MALEANSVSEFFEKSFEFRINQKNGINVFHRGVNQIYPKETRYMPSIYYESNHIDNEDKIFRDIVARFPKEMQEQKTTVEKLILMQHYRFPTRVLDITKNLLVSIFFACFEEKEPNGKDGVVYFFAVPEDEIRFCDSDRIRIVANLAKQPFGLRGGCDLSMSVEEFNKTEAIRQLCWDTQPESIILYDRVDPKHISSVFCLRPNMNNERINRQGGYFFLFGIADGKDKSKCPKINEDWLLEPIVIPAASKKKILDELDDMDINEGYFYPDYENIGKVIRRKYGK